MVHALFEESHFSDIFGVSYKEDDAMRNFAAMVGQNDQKLFVAHNETGPIGFLAVGVMQWVANNDEYFCFEKYFYVDKKHRNGSVSRKLIEAYEAWGKAIGAKAVEFGCTEPMRGEKVTRFLKRLGYTVAVRSHAKKLGG